MIIVLHGGDELSLRRRLHQIREEADGGTGMLATNTTELEGRDVTAQDILGPAMAVPFLAPSRLILVTRFLDRFEQRGGEQRTSRSADAFAPLLAAIRESLPPSTVLVLTGTAVRHNPMLDKLAKTPGVIVEEHAPPKNPQELARFIRDESAARGIRWKAGASTRDWEPGEGRPAMNDPVELLAGLVAFHDQATEQSFVSTLKITSELDKLALYTMGRPVTVDDVALLCAGDLQANGFAFRDGVLDGDLRKAQETLERLRRDHQAEQFLLTQLAAAYREAGTVVELLEQGKTEEEIGKAIGRPWPGLRQAAIRRARTLGQDGVRRAYAAIAEADRANKLGEIDEDLAMDILVVKLCGLVPRPAGRR